MRWITFSLGVALALACGFACGGDAAAPAAHGAGYVGGATCARCHDAEHRQWHGSHHDLAMQEPTEATVLGDFDDAEFTKAGVTTRLFRRGDSFVVNTDDANGESRDFEVAYVFGVTPLQQYLVRFPGGRLQALSICWDTRPKEQGGQRWFHLYDEPIPHDDPLHWTGRYQNWNYMCASCHSTGLTVGYDVASDTYDTRWHEIDVSCEACHGPGSAHVAWAQAGADPAKDYGLAFARTAPHSWVLDQGAVTARREPATPDRRELDTCAHCHSRRTVLDESFGGNFLDKHRPALLEAPDYYADGQIKEEVYVWGSFVQSKMHHAGVTCSDCHAPHDLSLRAEGNALCSRCHLPAAFDTPTHHHHEPGSAGAQCVTCHMPERTYMQVDPRRDHSLRVPRPDLTVRLGTPNACGSCHAEQGAQWAADQVAAWRGDKPLPAHFATAMHAGRERLAQAPDRLRALALDATAPALARATALVELTRIAAPGDALAALRDAEPLVRLGAVQSLGDAPLEARLPAVDLLDDPVRAVRIEAARVLIPLPREQIRPSAHPALDRATAELLASRELNGDQPWAQVDLAELARARGDLDAARVALERALRSEPGNTAARANLADLFRERGRDDLAESCLRDGLRVDPGDASLHYALGLTLVRLERRDEALVHLETATRNRPDEPQFAYAFGVALYSLGQQERGIEELTAALSRHPSDRALLTALVQYHQERGEMELARGYAERL